MSLSVAIAECLRRPPAAMPKLSKDLERAAKAVMDRWPDRDRPQADDEGAIARLAARVAQNDWVDASVAEVVRGARIAFREGFRDRPELKPLRLFLLRETAISTRAPVLARMASVYMETFKSGAEHTVALARAMTAARDRLAGPWPRLLRSFPSIFSPGQAAAEIASILAEADDPFARARAAGLNEPHGPGLMAAVHIALVDRLAPLLDGASDVDRLLSWVCPTEGAALQTGAGLAVEAILAPWDFANPPDDLRNRLTERLVTVWRDPRLHPGGLWATVTAQRKATLVKWLTRRDIVFFLDVVSKVECSHMWEPRRRFWLDLFHRGWITNAWVALSEAGDRLARRLTAGRVPTWGLQIAGGSRRDTSLLILQVGRAVVVEGSHNYKVHVFDGRHPGSPRLHLPRYDAEDIRHLVTADDPVVHNGSWQHRVLSQLQAMR